MATVVMDHPKMSIERLRAENYKVVDIPRKELGELSFVWNLLPRIGYDEGKSPPDVLSIGFERKNDGKWHLLGIVKYQAGLHDLPPFAELIRHVNPETGEIRLEIEPKPFGDFARYESLVAKLPEPFKTKIFKEALKYVDAKNEAFVKD